MRGEYLEKKLSKKILRKIIIVFFIFVFLFIFIYFFLLTQSPFNNKDEIIKISKNEQSSIVFTELKEKRVIRSINSLKLFLKIQSENGGIKSGTYLFKKGSPVYRIAEQLHFGVYQIEPTKVVIREGLDNLEISNILEKNITDFNKDLFLEKTKELQGYLFPDTYFFYPYVSTDEIINEMLDNFDHRIKSLKEKIENSEKSLSEIIVMASLLQGEAKGEEDIYLISGILWKRLDKNMLLQVDVDRQTYEIQGLPSNPINNPSLLAIKASLNPLSSQYYYYLHSKDGEVYFAENYEQHKENIRKYLRNK